jgi:3-hydroxymyristoyl/3-hydroxydecanoyl-(acyl carrier protein) dehydratase
MITFDFTILDNHPCLVGHFPGNPIVPGAIIMDGIINGIKNKINKITIINILNVKFLEVLKANVLVRVEIQQNQTLLKFNAFNENNLIVSGQLKITNKINE